LKILLQLKIVGDIALARIFLEQIRIEKAKFFSNSPLRLGRDGQNPVPPLLQNPRYCMVHCIITIIAILSLKELYILEDLTISPPPKPLVTPVHIKPE
jgi:hypothetical protein